MKGAMRIVTQRQACIHTGRHAYGQTEKQTNIHTYTYIPTCIHTDIHAYIHTYTLYWRTRPVVPEPIPEKGVAAFGYRVLGPGPPQSPTPAPTALRLATVCFVEVASFNHDLIMNQPRFKQACTVLLSVYVSVTCAFILMMNTPL